MKKRMTGRVYAIVALLLLVATVLTGCGGCGGSKVTLTANTVTAESIVVVQTEFNDATKTEQNPNGVGLDAFKAGLSDTQLNQIAQMLATAYSKGVNSQELIVAAYRGHNLLNPNPELDVNLVYEPDLKAAADAITKANNAVPDDQKVKAVDYGGNLNKTDLRVLVNSLKSNVDLSNEGGFVDKLLSAIGGFVNWLTRTIGFGSYIVGICIFAIIIEACMLPFSIKQQKNSIKQASLRPKEMAIRNKYKNRNDQASVQKMQQEIQEFYQRENFSPYSGCMPLLIQMPIIMALYYIVIDPFHYVLGQASSLSAALGTYFTTSRAAGGFGGVLQQAGNGTIEILSKLRDNSIEIFEGLKSFEFFGNGSQVYDAVASIKDGIPNFNIAGINFGMIPSFNDFGWLLLVPVLTFAVYFLSSKITRKLMNTQPKATSEIERKQMACSNVMMDVMMPAMSTYFTFVVPAIVGVYWIFRCLLNMLKQFIIARIMPLPVFTEEDYKAAAREMAGKRPVVKKSNNVGKVRSLHHIDDEDFEDTRERALARKAAIEEREREEQAARAEKSSAMSAPLKKADKKDQKPEEIKAEPKAEEPKAEEPKVEETKAEEIMNNETKPEEANVEATEAPIESTTETNEKTDEE